jgi:hypothetical protein
MPSNLLAAFAPGAATIAADAHRLANVSKRAGRLIMQILFFAVGLSAIQMRLGPQSFPKHTPRRRLRGQFSRASNAPFRDIFGDLAPGGCRAALRRMSAASRCLDDRESVGMFVAAMITKMSPSAQARGEVLNFRLFPFWQGMRDRHGHFLASLDVSFQQVSKDGNHRRQRRQAAGAAAARLIPCG